MSDCGQWSRIGHHTCSKETAHRGITSEESNAEIDADLDARVHREEDGINRHHVLDFCCNCRRQDVDIADAITSEGVSCQLVLNEISCGDVREHQSRTFCLIDNWNGDTMQLCNECVICLLEKVVSAESCWPAFIWKTICDCQEEFIWQLLPMAWRPWWLNAIRQVPSLQHVTLSSPETYFVDITNDSNRVSRSLKELR